MTENPYAPPVVVEAASYADQEIRSVVRTMRMLSWFGIVFSVFVATMGVGMSLVRFSVAPDDLAVGLIHAPVLIFSILYLRLAGVMARKNLAYQRQAVVGAYLMCLGFPLFPVGFFCIPLFVPLGLLCASKVRRHYQEFCDWPPPEREEFP